MVRIKVHALEKNALAETQLSKVGQNAFCIVDLNNNHVSLLNCF